MYDQPLEADRSCVFSLTWSSFSPAFSFSLPRRASHQTGTRRHRQLQQGRRGRRVRRRHRNVGARRPRQGRLQVGDQPAPGDRGQRQHRAQRRARASRSASTTFTFPFNAPQPDPKVVDQFLAAIANKANQPAYVHCGSASRVGAVWLVKRVLQDGWTDREGDRRSKVDRPAQRAAREVRALATSPRTRKA